MDKQIIVAASNVFGVPESVIAANVKALQDAPIALVEYPKYLKGERKHEYDARRENIGVYTGDIKTLVKGLKATGGRAVAGLTPWEIIFTFFKQIAPDLTSAMQEESATLAKTEDGEISNVEEKIPSETKLVTDEVATVADDASNSTAEPVRKEDDIPTEKKPEEHEPESVGETGAISGDTINEQGTAKCATNMEVPKMDQSTNLTDIAKKIQEETKAEEVKVETAEAKKSTKPEKLDKDIQGEVAEMLNGTQADRYNYMNSNHITAIVATAPSVKDRLVQATGIKGVLADAGNAADPKKAVVEKLNKKLLGHIQKCTGKDDMTEEKWNGLSEAEQYVNCETDADRAMAKKIIAAIIEARVAASNNTAAPVFDLAAPAESNVNYKGLVIGNEVVSKKALVTLLVDKTPGALFAEGMVAADGTYTELGQDKDKRIEVRLQVKQTNNKNSKQTTSELVTSGNGKTTFTTTALKGRKPLVQAGKVKYLYPDVNKQSERNASLMVTFGGVPASYKYFKLDDKGEKIIIGEGDKAHPAKGTASLKGVGKVFEIVKVMPQEILGERTPKAAADYWDVNYTAEKVENQAISLNFDESPVFAVITTIGALSNVSKSKTQEQVNALLNKKSAADAADAGSSLAI